MTIGGKQLNSALRFIQCNAMQHELNACATCIKFKHYKMFMFELLGRYLATLAYRARSIRHFRRYLVRSCVIRSFVCV
jgi:hypothetical protein